MRSYFFEIIVGYKNRAFFPFCGAPKFFNFCSSSGEIWGASLTSFKGCIHMLSVNHAEYIMFCTINSALEVYFGYLVTGGMFFIISIV